MVGFGGSLIYVSNTFTDEVGEEIIDWRMWGEKKKKERKKELERLLEREGRE